MGASAHCGCCANTLRTRRIAAAPGFRNTYACFKFFKNAAACAPGRFSRLVISSAVEKSNGMARSTTFCPPHRGFAAFNQRNKRIGKNTYPFIGGTESRKNAHRIIPDKQNGILLPSRFAAIRLSAIRKTISRKPGLMPCRWLAPCKRLSLRLYRSALTAVLLVPCAFSLMVCDKARDTVYKNVFRFTVFKL